MGGGIAGKLGSVVPTQWLLQRGASQSFAVGQCWGYRNKSLLLPGPDYCFLLLGLMWCIFFSQWIFGLCKVHLCFDSPLREITGGYPTPVNEARAASAGVERAPLCPWSHLVHILPPHPENVPGQYYLMAKLRFKPPFSHSEHLPSKLSTSQHMMAQTLRKIASNGRNHAAVSWNNAPD